PRRHRPLAGPIDLRIGVASGFDGQSPGALLVGIGSHLILLHCNIPRSEGPSGLRQNPMSVATRAGSVLQAGSREVHLAAKGIVRIASLCLDGRGMTRCRLTLLVRFAKSVHS